MTSLKHMSRTQSPMRLTPRDIQLIRAVHAHRVLRRDQIERLLFPSKNTANARLCRLYVHGYLARRRLPVEYGQGSGQALYMLAGRGAQIVAEGLGVDVAETGWKRSQNHVSSMFLEHTLMINDIRIALTLAARHRDCTVTRWLREDQLKADPDRVWIETSPGRRRQVALVPDAYLTLRAERRQAHFFLEADRATESNGRFGQKVAAYVSYVRSGGYARRYGTRSLRVLTVTTGETRLRNLLRTTARVAAGMASLFWFTHLAALSETTVLSAPIWHIAGRPEPQILIGPEPTSPQPSLPTAQLLFQS